MRHIELLATSIPNILRNVWKKSSPKGLLFARIMDIPIRKSNSSRDPTPPMRSTNCGFIYPNRIFRIFYELYKEGEFLKQASVERRQTWDEQALKELRNYCTEGFISIYLRDTNRRFNVFTPLDDKYYDTALANIKRLLDEKLDHFVKF